MGWKLTVRSGPRVQRSSYDDVAAALEALESQGKELAHAAPRDPVDAKFRRFEAGERVIARLELAGPERFVPSVRAGVDIHGDGSVQAYSGRVRREPVQPQRGENAYAALRRTLAP